MFSTQAEIETPATHPQYEFEVRIFECPDSVARVVNFPTFMWEYFDRFVKDKEGYFEAVIARCTRFWLELLLDNKSNVTFSELLHYQVSLDFHMEEAKKEGRSIYYAWQFNICASPHQP